MNLPLMRSWTLHADALPERLLETETRGFAFHLPGIDALSEFADLLGVEEADDAPSPSGESVPFALPALLPDDVCGPVSLECEIDFSAYAGDAATLCMDNICGGGEVMLQFCARPGEKQEEAIALASFQSGPLALDLTQALARRRRCRVMLRFDGTRPPGVFGAVTLRISANAAFGDILLIPQSALHTLTLKTEITAVRAGDYLLRAQLCPPSAPACEEDVPPIRETSMTLSAGETRPISLTMEAQCGAFIPGQPYDAPALKIWLYTRQPSGQPGAPCDERLLMCGFPGSAPASFLPLNAHDALLPGDTLLQRLRALHVSAVSLPVAAPDLFYRDMTRAGVAVRQTMETSPDERPRLSRWPCVTFDETFTHRPVDNCDPVLRAWRLCGLVTYPRVADPDMTPSDMLLDAAGRAIDPAAEQTQAVLAWLSAISVRLRAEAIRQGQLSGALCAPGEWETPDIAQALQTALAPLHLSVLPLCGAWWTGSRFSASIHAFIPKERFPEGTAVRAEVILEDAQGETLARTDFPCPENGGLLGLIEAMLPQCACVLELTARLYAGETLAEEHALPVYVGDRGPLEAAF